MPTSAPATAPLTTLQRRELRAAAHHLDPVVMIGDAGLSAGVLAEADRALTAHELVKLRVFGEDRQQRRDILAALCAELGCQPVQEIGKLLVVYRQRPPAEPREHVPKKLAATGATKPRPKARKAGKATTGGKPGPKPAAKAAQGTARKPIGKSPARPATGALPARKAGSAPIQRRAGAGPVTAGGKRVGGAPARRRSPGRSPR